ncbi:MAG: S26 family signal peptidase [Candidatus Omnitrophica bacterium]|nr:S26 family signal peptidase [Candidatus Omnitrophota bacterium]
MAPVLNPGELVVVQDGAYASAMPRRGELAAARPAALGGRACVKRVAGLPHERVRVGEREWPLGEGQFFLLGDRAEESCDSRAFGPVARGELIGPVRLRLWPWRVF